MKLEKETRTYNKGQQKWFIEDVLDIAKKYENYSQFNLNEPSLRRTACSNGWIQTIKDSFDTKAIHGNTKYTYEVVKEIASKYKTRKEFEKGNASAYIACLNFGYDMYEFFGEKNYKKNLTD